MNKPDNTAELEKAIGYTFKNRSLLEAALTHRSFRFEHAETEVDNQRLEFLGDAVVGLVLAEWTYRRFGHSQEGQMTVLRSSVASEHGLSRGAALIGLGEYMRFGKGELRSGGKERDSNLADAMESLIAAVYLDGGLEAAASVIGKIFKSQLESLGSIADDTWTDNPRGHLQHISQYYHHVAPVYTMLEEAGPAHDRTYRASVSVNGKYTAEGEGKSKQAAQSAAAAALLRTLPAEPKPAARK